jgi:hypothetical protein
VFITALLMAEPHETDEPVAQIEVDSNKPTGFIAPAGWYGFIRAAGPGIVRRALVAADAGIEALRRLGSPDPESRTPDHEGRRLIRVDGGYLILNFMRYRDKDSTTAERSRRYRERQKALRNGVTQRDERDATAFASPAEAEAEKELELPIGSLSAATPLDALDEGQAGKGRPPCPHSRIVALYHESLPELRQVREWNDARQRLLAKRWAENPERQSLGWWREFFGYVRKSPFLMGQTQGRDGRPFDCDLEWLIRPTNFAKVVEGKYEGAPR